MTMTLTRKVKPYKKGFGPFAPEVYRAPAPYPYRGHLHRRRDRRARAALPRPRRPGDGRRRDPRARPGRGRLHRDARGLPAPLRELCDRHGILWIDDEVQSGVGRTGPMWAIEHYDAQPDLLVSGKSLGGGLPLAAVTGPAAIMDAVDPGGLGGTFGGNPVSCAAANVVLDAVPGLRAQTEALGGELRAALEDIGDARGRDRRGPRARPDARARDRPRPRVEDAGARARRGRDRGRARGGPAAARRAACTATSSACCRR